MGQKVDHSYRGVIIIPKEYIACEFVESILSCSSKPQHRFTVGTIIATIHNQEQIGEEEGNLRMIMIKKTTTTKTPYQLQVTGYHSLSTLDCQDVRGSIFL